MQVRTWATWDRTFQNGCVCSRCKKHCLRFYSEVVDGKLRKVGQIPALAELHLPDVQQYREVLGDRYSDLARGIGLSTHGIGIGAFVYLRRVFEHLVEEARAEAAKDSGWDEGAYQRSRMNEKIELLAGYLPDFLVDNRGLYRILSLGIHELTEEECLKHFQVVRTGIELILDEKLVAVRRAKKIIQATKDVARVHGTLKTGTSEDQDPVATP